MMERFSATVESDLLARFDRFLGGKGYANRSEAVRDLIRNALVQEEWQSGKGEVMGVVSLVYDHHHPGLLNRMTRIQHDTSADVISTTHVHMDHHNCLEIVIVRGRPDQVRKLADTLVALKGVKNGSLSAATTGRGLV